MTTRIESNGPAPLVTSTHTQGRTTPQPTRPFQQVMGAGASAVVAGAEAAVRRLPGGRGREACATTCGPPCRP